LIQIIDTGIDTTLPEFQGRAVFGINFDPEGTDAYTTDLNGHGTQYFL
jgi:subtilisin family serine protease